LTSERASPQIPNAASVTQRQDEKNVIDKHFQEEVRDQLKPGMSALFLVVENVTPDKALAALSKFGGTVMRIPDRRCEHGGDGDNLETGGGLAASTGSVSVTTNRSKAPAASR
jgi:Protein of unknown function (DUF1269)